MSSRVEWRGQLGGTLILLWERLGVYHGVSE